MLEKLKDESDTIEWNVNEELKLLIAMVGYKPVGVNRHFMMLMIHDRFSKALNKQISSQVIWKHLDTMYDMAALHESEIIPFPNDKVEFELPKEFDPVAVERLGHSLPHNEKNAVPEPDFLKKRFNYPNKLKQPLFTPNPRKTRNSYVTKQSTFNTPQSTSKVGKVVKTDLNKENSETNATKLKVEQCDPNKNIRSKRSSTPIAETKVKQENPFTSQGKNDSSSDSSIKKSVKQEAISDFNKKKTSKQEFAESAEKNQKTDFSDSVAEKLKSDTVSESVGKKTTKQDSASDSSSEKARSDTSSESSTKKSLKQSTISETLKKTTKSDTPISKKVSKDSKLETLENDRRAKDATPKKLRQASSVESLSNKRNSKVDKSPMKKKIESTANVEKKSSKAENMEQSKNKTELQSVSKRASKSLRVSAKAEEPENSRKRKHAKKEESSPARSSPASKRKR